MIQELIDKVGASIKGFFLSLVTFSWIPEIWFWYGYLALFFLFIGAVIWLFGWSKVVRMVASMLFLAAAIFTAGGHVMARRLKEREGASEPEPEPEPEKKPERQWPW